MYNVGRDHIRKQLGVYLTELREEFSKGLILPKKDDINKVRTANNYSTYTDFVHPTFKQNTPKSDGVAKMSSAFSKKINMQPIVSSGDKPLGCKLTLTTIQVSENFQCRANDIYDAWTKPEMVSAFTRGPCKLDASKGGM